MSSDPSPSVVQPPIASPPSTSSEHAAGRAAATTNVGKLHGIEAGRGVAAMLVVLYHASNHMGRNIGYAPLHGFFQFGHAGVDFFFVLSGFIIFFIHRPDLGRSARLAHFAERRFTRIYPLYWFVLIAGIGMSIAARGRTPESLGTILYDLTLLPTVGEPMIGVAWTLQHELLFYAIFAIAILTRRVGVALMTLWLLAIALHAWVGLPVQGAFLDKLLSPFNLEFFFGMFAAWIVGSSRFSRATIVLAAGSVAFVAVSAVEDVGWLDGYATAARLGYGLSAMLVVVGLASLRMGDGVVARCFAALGAASYSIYLVHLTFIGLVYKITEVTGVFQKAPVPLTYLLMSASGILGGVLVSRFVEYPLIRIVRDGLRSSRPVASVARP